MPRQILKCIAILLMASCFLSNLSDLQSQEKGPSASDLLGNPDFVAISFGGFRDVSQTNVPSVEDLKEDLRILSAMGIKLLRTYKTQKNEHAPRLLEAIEQLRKEDPTFQMYVMLGVWIDCQGAWTASPNHEAEDEVENTREIETAVRLAKQYPEIVKVIAVGNEAMVTWAAGYFVRPAVILKWVQYLQSLKQQGELPSDLWITSSDNFASWGGGDIGYHTDELKSLIRAVDFVSMHTYPFHDSHYNSEYWQVPEDEKDLSIQDQADRAMERAVAYAKGQYEATQAYVHSIDPTKPVHIGETGWSTQDNVLYGAKGSGAADEYKQKKYYDGMREWTQKEGISCFFFEAFDEPWKDANNQQGSENHFGLFTVDGQAKFAIWEECDTAGLAELKRGSQAIRKTYDGQVDRVLSDLLAVAAEPVNQFIDTVNPDHSVGEPVTADRYWVFAEPESSDGSISGTYPSARLKVNVWEGTCQFSIKDDSVLNIIPGANPDQWWGCALEIQADGKGEDLSAFKSGKMNFDIKGTPGTRFEIGFQTGQYSAGNQTNNFVTFGKNDEYNLSEDWRTYSIPIPELNQGADLKDVTSLLFLRSGQGTSDASIEVKNIYFSK